MSVGVVTVRRNEANGAKKKGLGNVVKMEIKDARGCRKSNDCADAAELWPELMRL